MSFDSVPSSDMTLLRDRSARDIDRLLTGRIPAGMAEIEDLTGFFRGLGEAFPEPRISDLESGHIAAMMEATAQVGAPQPLTSASSELAVPTIVVERKRPSGFLIGLRTRLLAASAAVVTVFSGMAVAGVLPPPIQRAVADVAAFVGIDLPGASRNVHPDDARTDDHGEDGKPPTKERERLEQEDNGGSLGGGGLGDAAAGGRQSEDTADHSKDAKEDAADDARDAKEDPADDARDAKEDAADDARDAKEDAADDARDAKEDAADDARDAKEDAADDEEASEDGKGDDTD